MLYDQGVRAPPSGLLKLREPASHQGKTGMKPEGQPLEACLPSLQRWGRNFTHLVPVRSQIATQFKGRIMQQGAQRGFQIRSQTIISTRLVRWFTPSCWLCPGALLGFWPRPQHTFPSPHRAQRVSDSPSLFPAAPTNPSLSCFSPLDWL